jgi:DEAD/DEAH box helicase domain-containing protein
MANIVYFDLETQKSAAEVGGWAHKGKMLVSIGVTFSTADNAYRIFDEAHVNDLVKELRRADLVVGFNIVNFDYAVLAGYPLADVTDVPTLDLMVDLEKKLGHRLGLDAIAKATLPSVSKTADGMQALRWWKEGKVMEIAEYCCFDVKVTKEVHEYGRKHGAVFYNDRMGQKRRVEVAW